MDNVGLEQFEFQDWDKPERPKRGPAKLYLPGNECIYRIAGYTTEEVPIDPDTATTSPTRDGSTGDDASETETETEIVKTPHYVKQRSGTTIAPDVLDPYAPVPSVARSQVVRSC